MLGNSIEAMGLFPPKTEDDDETINTGMRIRRSLLEKLDWIGQREGYSRNFCIELAMEKLIEVYGKEQGMAVGRIALDAKKARHRTKLKAKK